MNLSQKLFFTLSPILILAINCQNLAAEEITDSIRSCLIEQLKSDNKPSTLQQIIKLCKSTTLMKQIALTAPLSNIEKRIEREISTRDNPSVITPHKRSYFLPVSYVNSPNEEPYIDFSNQGALDNLEAKFQISFKAPLITQLFSKKDAIHFGFTIQSYWQMYNTQLSSPFRETNYQPEIFYSYINDYETVGWTSRVIQLGIEHQSNGGVQAISRSWNRIYANFVFEKDNWIISFKPWYRLPEDEKTSPDQPDGDDNPDINKFLGHFELATIYRWGEQNISLMLRNNLQSNNRGAAQLDWSFPMGKRFKGYVQYFNGYGESLIDYNHSIERIGVGVLLTDFF